MTRRKTSPARLWPTASYFDALMPKDAELRHPVDEIIEGTAAVRRAQRKVLRLYDKVEVTPRSEKVFRQYADARLDLEILRQTVAFDVGVELGVATGRAQMLPGRAAHIHNDLREIVQSLLVGAGTRAEARLPALLRAAYALAAGVTSAREVANIAAGTMRRPAK